MEDNNNNKKYAGSFEGKALTETIWLAVFKRDYSASEKKAQVSAAAARNGGPQPYCNVPISPPSGSSNRDDTLY